MIDRRGAAISAASIAVLLCVGGVVLQQAAWSQELASFAESADQADENGGKSAETRGPSQTKQTSRQTQPGGNTLPSEQNPAPDEGAASQRSSTQNSGSADKDATDTERTDYFNEDLLRKLLHGNARDDGPAADGEQPGDGEQSGDREQGDREQAGGDDPLETAIRSMRDAQERLSARDTGAATQKLQQQAVDELTRLIDMAENRSSQQNPPPPEDRPENDQARSQKQASQSDAEQSSQETQQTQQPAGTGKTEAGQSDKAEESSERTGQAENREVELLRRRALLQQVWGHLPPGIRQKLLNVTSEKPLPEYEDLIRRYYEALADDGDKVTR